MPIKAVIFDFDLTLADSSQGVYQCMNHALKKLGYPPADFQTIKRTIGYTLPESFRILSGSMDEESAKSFVEEYVSYADLVMNQSTIVFPEVFSVLPILRSQNLRTVIVSTKYRYRIEEILKRDSLVPFFDLIIGGEDVTKHKPDPEGLFRAIDSLGLDNADVLFVGDSLVDLTAAKNAKVDFCAVLTGATTKDEFTTSNSVHIIENLEGLINILSRTE